jgi:hypothetical protein
MTFSAGYSYHASVKGQEDGSSGGFGVKIGAWNLTAFFSGAWVLTKGEVPEGVMSRWERYGDSNRPFTGVTFTTHGYLIGCTASYRDLR